MEKQALLNTYINNVTMPETIAAIEKMIADGKKSYVVAINVDVVMKIENDSYLKQVVDNADMVLVDGKPLVWISKLHGKPLKAKISGWFRSFAKLQLRRTIRSLLSEEKKELQNRRSGNWKKSFPESGFWEHMRRRLDLKRIKKSWIKSIT